MKRVFYLITVVAALTSCAESYNIQGSSTVSLLDGSKLYLKVMADKEMKNIDSCEVVHGKFRFAGLFDGIQMAALFMDDKSVMPLVVERGDINVMIEDAQQKVSGSPLNDLLYDFLDKRRQLGNRLEELDHRYSQMLLDGIDEQTIEQQLSAEAATITHQEDSLVTNFVMGNYDNVLGPFVFVQMSSSIPQIEHIMSQAPDTFKNDPMVSDFYQHVTQDNAQKEAAGSSSSASDIDDETIQNILNGK